MAARSVASMTISFGVVSIPAKVYTATESKSGVGFNLMHRECGTRLKQQYVCPHEGKVVERSDMAKGYEFAKDKYVTFEPSRFEALEVSASDRHRNVHADRSDRRHLSRQSLLSRTHKRGGKPYQLLYQAMKGSGTCALARWVWKAKQHMVRLRAGPDGLILQTLLYGDEVRSQAALGIETPDVQPAELQLAEQLIEQYRVESYDASEFKDEEKERILAEIDKKIAGNKITAAPDIEQPRAQVIDLVDALRASLTKKPPAQARATPHAATGKLAKPAEAAETAPFPVPVFRAGAGCSSVVARRTARRFAFWSTAPSARILSSLYRALA